MQTQSKYIQGRNFILREMNNDDVDSVVQIEKMVFITPWSTDAFLAGFSQQYTKSYIIESDKIIIAYAVVWLVVDELHFANLAVEENFRNIGLAQWLINEILCIAKAKNCKIAHLEVRRSNTIAIALYKKFGFKITGVRKNYYSEQKEDAFLMSTMLINTI